MQNKEALEILLGALTDAEWTQLKHLRESRSANQITNMVVARKTSAIRFADWILMNTVRSGYDKDGRCYWILLDGSNRVFTSEELYNAYINGLFEPDINGLFEPEEDEDE
jgi:hypothetical protein